MKPKDNTSIPHGLIVFEPLTPEQASELERVIKVELARETRLSSMSVLVNSSDCDNCTLIRDRKVLWFIAGIGTGALVTMLAFVALVLWMV